MYYESNNFVIVRLNIHYLFALRHCFIHSIYLICYLFDSRFFLYFVIMLILIFHNNISLSIFSGIWDNCQILLPSNVQIN